MAGSIPLIEYHDLESRVKAMERDGYVYFPNVLKAEEIAELKAGLDALEPIEENFDHYSTPEKVVCGKNQKQCFLQKHIKNIFNHNAFYLQYVDRSPVIELTEAIHGEDCHIIGQTGWVTGQGRPDQNLHVDWLPVPLPEEVMNNPKVKLPIFITTAHFYLNDIDEEIGPTKFVPGSHRSGRAPDGDTTWNGVEEQSIHCKAGDVIQFRSEVWHRGSANKSSKTRYLMQVHYSHRMITQKFPPYLHRFRFNESILAQATPRQRRLLGEHNPSNYD
jgi:ectoine hydroxylase-related dioxygenase (phytanoyl-CoA dioxygenase family)